MRANRKCGVEQMMGKSRRKLSLVDKLLVVLIVGALLGGVAGILSASDSLPDLVTAKDPEDPFEPPEEFEDEIIEENDNDEENDEDPPLYFRRFDLKFITAEQLQSLISPLGIDLYSVDIDENQRTLWARGTAQELWLLDQLVKAVDRPENEVSLDYRTLTTEHITPEQLVQLMGEMGIGPQRFVVKENKLLIFDRELLRRWSSIRALASDLDQPGSRDKIVYIYRLRYLTAEDAEDRLNTVSLSDVTLKTFNYPEYSQELMIICPPHMQEQVNETIEVMDTLRRQVRVPIHRESGDHARRKLEALRSLLSELSGVSEGSMHISGNLSGDINNPEHVLWVESSPDNVKQLEALIARIR